MDPKGEITRLLVAYRDGEARAFDALLPFVYQELRGMAHGQLRGERKDHTMNTTALVHEAYLKLVDYQRIQWNDRNHFFAIAAQAMRRILVDYALQRRRLKRGGGAPKVALDDVQVASEDRAELVIALNEALTHLEAINERQARIVECRYFAGYTNEETAEILGISARTVKREWALARTWLFRHLSSSE